MSCGSLTTLRCESHQTNNPPPHHCFPVWLLLWRFVSLIVMGWDNKLYIHSALYQEMRRNASRKHEMIGCVMIFHSLRRRRNNTLQAVDLPPNWTMLQKREYLVLKFPALRQQRKDSKTSSYQEVLISKKRQDQTTTFLGSHNKVNHSCCRLVSSTRLLRLS